MQIVISITAIVMAAFYPPYFAGRKSSSSPPLPLSAVVLLAATLEFFDLMTVLQPADVYFWKQISLFFEALLPPAWLWFSLTYAREGEPLVISLPQRLFLICSPLFLVGVALLPVTSFFYSPDFGVEKVLFLGEAGFLFYFVLLIYLVISLMNLEVTLANTTFVSRWKIKLELLGAGALLAVMIFYYSNGLLFRTINMHLVTARMIVLIVAVAMLTYSRLKRGSGVKVYVSRQIAYKSVVMFVVGLYLISLGLTGEGMKHFGEGFQRSILIGLAFIAGLALVVVLLSETVKRKIATFIQKNFYQNKYDYRTQWLQFTDRLSSSVTGDEVLRSIILGFCDTFGMGSGGLFHLDHQRGIYQLSMEISLEQATGLVLPADEVRKEGIFSSCWLQDLRKDGPAHGPDQWRQLLSERGVSFLIPLFIHDGIDGFIVLAEPINGNETYNFEDFDLMRTLAKQASSALLNFRLSGQLARSREMAAIGKVSAFVMHDLKNLVSTISLMLDNARDYIAVPQFQEEMLLSLGSTADKMKELISRLRNLPEKDVRQRSVIDLLLLAHETAGIIGGDVFHVVGSTALTWGDPDELQKVALNLMLNAVEATDGSKPVTVEVGVNDWVYVRVRDEGCGIPAEFLATDLFTPFKTTKQKGLGIGLYQCKQIVEAHGGKIEVNSIVNRGSEFTVWLPNLH